MQIKINLLYPATEAHIRKAQKGVNRPLVALCLIINIAAVISAGGLYWYNQELEKNIKKAEKQIAAMKSTQAVIDERTRLVGDVVLIKKETEYALKNQNNAALVLDEITKIIPRNVKTKKIIVSYTPLNKDGLQRTIFIKGEGPDHLATAQFARQLQISPLSENALINFFKRYDQPQPVNQVHFEVTATSSSPKGGSK